MRVLEKILEEIEKKKQALEYNLQFEVGQASINEIRNRVSGLKYAEEIIRSHMDDVTDTNNGWIPVEDGLPEEHDSIFAKFKGTDMWSNAMFEKSSDKVNVTFEFEDGTRKSGTSYTIDGKWECEKGNCAVKRKVIAWSSLPEPYKAD